MNEQKCHDIQLFEFDTFSEMFKFKQKVELANIEEFKNISMECYYK
jgi:hypothetical protein